MAYFLDLTGSISHLYNKGAAKLCALFVISCLSTMTGCSSVLNQTSLDAPPVIQEKQVSQEEILALVNGYRQQNGLPPLTISETLITASQNMARHIAERDTMDTWAHSAFGLAERLSKLGYANVAAAENLAAGVNTTPGVVQLWKGSEGHNKNLLNPHVSEMGFAAATRSTGKWKMFWVLTLARPAP
ncbi:MAG: CAP domain-containing protein [Rhodobacteraceae bacterium]|nr:CAP domain-containing protein [Paracoccaceae bacterium]